MDAAPTEPDFDAGELQLQTLKIVLLAVMFAVLLILFIFLLVTMWPTLVYHYQRLIPVDKKRLDRRRQTVREWTISKVSERRRPQWLVTDDLAHQHLTTRLSNYL